MSENIKEGLSAIAREILSDVRKEAEDIIRDAETEAKETLRIAKEAADKTYVNIIAKNASAIEAEKRRLQSLTEVETRNNLLQVKEELMDAAFQLAKAKLSEFAKTERYRAYLTALIEEGVRKICSKDLTLVANSTDQAWLQRGNDLNALAKKLHVNLTLSQETTECIGGCIIQTADKKKTMDNTLDNRFEQLKPELRVKAAAILFDREESQIAS